MIRFLNSITPFLLFCLVMFPRIIKGQQYCSGPTYTPNSTYHTNLIRLLSSLSSNVIQSNGFYRTTVGQNSDNTVYGLFLCRGDVTIAGCDRCVSSAIKDITTPQKCPNTTQAVGWYGYECMIRYSDKYIFSVEDANPLGIIDNIDNATRPKWFYGRRLIPNAVAKQGCVSYNIKCEYATCCFGKIGAVVLAASCTVKYELYPFYRMPLTSFEFASSEVDIPAYHAHNCTINNFFNSDSHYQFNLNILLISLNSKATTTDTAPKFYNDTVGTPNMNDAVYGEYMCEATSPWSAVRYSNRYFFSTLHQLPTVNSFLPDDMGAVMNTVSRITACAGRSTPCGIPSSLGVTNQKGVSESEYIELNQTLNNAVVEAETSNKRFATKEANFTSGGSLCNLRFQLDSRFYYKDNQPPSDLSSQESGSPSLAKWNCSTTKDNYTTNDSYLNNLGNLFEDLSKSSNITNNNGFYSTMVGNKSNTVYGLFMCRGDVSFQLCNECVNEGIEQLKYYCSFSKEAIIWYDMCMVRYSNSSFFSTLDTQPIYTKHGADMLPDQKDGFNQQLADTLNDLVTATLNSTPIGAKNFATHKEFSS
ncbi:hypothetical protein K1719_004983 [Acacia pycnantha]|nr:hypothetical protein K1719_004983 [Acacia pycnantha]